MKLAVITDEISPDLDHALDVMLEYGVRGAELRNLWDKNVADAPRDYWVRAKDALDKRGMVAVGVASPFYKCALPGTHAPDGEVGPLHSATARGLGDQMKVLEHCAAAAQYFNTNLLRVFSFWKQGPLTPAVEEQIVDAFAEPAAFAEREGLILGLENEHACFLGTGAQSARVLAEINSPAVRLIWDPGNAYMDGEQPFPTGWEAAKDWTVHVHIKDAAPGANGGPPEWTEVGKGVIDFPGQIAALRESSYAGYLSLETHWKGLGDAETSSRACLAALKRLTEA